MEMFQTVLVKSLTTVISVQLELGVEGAGVKVHHAWVPRPTLILAVV